MKKKSSCCTRYLLILALLTFTTYHSASAAPRPLSGMFYAENSAEETENMLLLQRLKDVASLKHEILEDERRLTEAELDIQAILEVKARNQRVPRPLESEVDTVGEGEEEEAAEMLPIPSAIVQHDPGHSGKRTSYMALCHFKICNMGRKRQL